MRKISNILFLLLTLFCTALMTACGDPDITEPTTVLSLSDLPGKSIGVLKDSPADLAASVLEDPASDQAPAVVVRYKKLDDAVKDLKKAKLDCVILDSFSAAQYYMENGKLAVLEDAFSWQEYSIWPWCAPCRMVAPIIEEIASERPDIKVGKINVDEQPELASKFGIMSIPTLVVMKNGKIVTKVSGARPKKAILEML